jgi:hypothetical protein
MYDLYFTSFGEQGITQAGRDFIHSILIRRPLFPPLDVRLAQQNGLRVSFADKDALDYADVDITDVADPGSTSTETGDWKPMDAPLGTPGYADNGPSDGCDDLEDDSPDEALCDSIMDAELDTDGETEEM